MIPGHVVAFWLSVSSLGPVRGQFYAGTLTRREDHWFDVVARLAPGVSPRQAQAAMDILAQGLAREYPDDNAGRDITVMAATSVRVHPDTDRMIYPAGAVLMSIVGLVLLVACANLANLVLARGIAREREVAIRAAIGASRGRVIRHLMMESVVLALAGGALGLAGAERLAHAVSTRQLPLPIRGDLTFALDERVIGFTLGLSVLTALAFGLLPAFRTSRPDLVGNLKDCDGSARGSGGGTRWFGLRDAFVVAQVSASLVLLIAAGLLTRSLRNAYAVDIGIETAQLAVIQPDPGQAAYAPDRAPRFYEELTRRIRALPGVQTAGVTSRLPLQGGASSTLIFAQSDMPGARTGVEVGFASVGPQYLETIGVPLLYGRPFTGTDAERDAGAVIVTESLARQYLGTADAVNRSFRYAADSEAPVQIIGVVPDVKVQ